MTLRLDFELTESEKTAMGAIPATSWFTQIIYRNAESSIHPNRRLVNNNEMKQAMVSDWVVESVKGKRVLDLFSANGGFRLYCCTCRRKGSGRRRVF